MTKTKETRKKPLQAPPPEFLSRKERLVAGKLLRDKVPRERHAAWKPSSKRRDPIDALEESNRDRKGIDEVHANSLVVPVALIPFVAVKELGCVLGRERVAALFFRNRVKRWEEVT